MGDLFLRLGLCFCQKNGFKTNLAIEIFFGDLFLRRGLVLKQKPRVDVRIDHWWIFEEMEKSVTAIVKTALLISQM